MSLSQTFLQNPQFYLAMTSSSTSSKCQVSVVLSQHEIRETAAGSEEETVDYKSLYVFRLHDLPQQQQQQPFSTTTTSSKDLHFEKLTQMPRSKQIYKKFDSFQNARDISIEFQVWDLISFFPLLMPPPPLSLSCRLKKGIL
jgi:hypothetical protein